LPEDSYHCNSCANKRTLNNRPHGEEVQKKIKVTKSEEMIVIFILLVYFMVWATNRKIAGLIPDGVIGIFH
jgi:hypothetical protein